MDVVITFLICWAVGLMIGFGIRYLLDRRNPAGTLRIDTSDPNDNPYLFLELETDISDVRRKKYVTLKVNTISYIPRK